MASRSPHPKCAIAKVCRIQGCKMQLKCKNTYFWFFKVFTKSKIRQNIAFNDLKKISIYVCKMFKLRKEKMEKIKNVLLQTVAVIV